MTPRARFILRFGVLGYGGGIFLVFNLLHIARLHARGVSLRGLPLLLLITAIISPVLVTASARWHGGVSERDS